MKKTIVMIFGLCGLTVLTASAQASSTEAQICVNCVIQEAEKSKTLKESEIAQLRELLEKINQGLPVDPGQSIIGGFIRNKDGSVKTDLNQYDAAEECKRRGSRLPTAREFAKEAEKQGGKLLEARKSAAGKIPGKIPRGYAKDVFYKVTSIEKGKTDTFYFSALNYQRPSGDLGTYWTWSSSIHGDDDSFARVFNGYDGDVEDVYRGSHLDSVAARCVVGGDRVK